MLDHRERAMQLGRLVVEAARNLLEKSEFSEEASAVILRAFEVEITATIESILSEEAAFLRQGIDLASDWHLKITRLRTSELLARLLVQIKVTENLPAVAPRLMSEFDVFRYSLNEIRGNFYERGNLAADVLPANWRGNFRQQWNELLWHLASRLSSEHIHKRREEEIPLTAAMSNLAADFVLAAQDALYIYERRIRRRKLMHDLFPFLPYLIR